MIQQSSISKSARLTPPLKYPGGKTYLAEDIISLMPAHTQYVEPYFGGGTVCISPQLAADEVRANDLIGPRNQMATILLEKNDLK